MIGRSQSSLIMANSTCLLRWAFQTPTACTLKLVLCSFSGLSRCVKLVTVCLALLAHILECRPTIFLMKVTCSQNLTQCKPGMTSLSVFIPTQMVPVHNIHMLQCSTSVYFRSAWVQNPWRNLCVLSSVLTRFRGTSTIGAYHRQVNNIWLENCISDAVTPFRFIRAFEAWSSSQVTQSHNRSQDRIPSVDEFILMRRATIGGALVEGKNIS